MNPKVFLYNTALSALPCLVGLFPSQMFRFFFTVSGFTELNIFINFFTPKNRIKKKTLNVMQAHGNLPLRASRAICQKVFIYTEPVI